jgi:hypothetical protein
MRLPTRVAVTVAPSTRPAGRAAASPKPAPAVATDSGRSRSHACSRGQRPEGHALAPLVVEDAKPQRQPSLLARMAPELRADGLGDGQAASVEGRNDLGTSGYRALPAARHGRHHAIDSHPD